MPESNAFETRSEDLTGPQRATPAMPDPLRRNDGSVIKSADEWQRIRAPELRTLFERYIYGSVPPIPRRMTASVVYDDSSAFDGAARIREVELAFSDPDLVLRLLLATPSRAGQAGCFLGLNFRGNHCLMLDPFIKLPAGWTRDSGAPRGSEIDTWCVETVVKRGYAFASFAMGDVVGDDPSLAPPRLDELGHGLETRPGAIMAWAWGLSRAIDYLEGLEGIDSRSVALVGHSRNGKAATVAAAFDSRVAMVVANGAGCGGTAPFRIGPEVGLIGPDGRPSVETLALITSRFPYWFSPQLASFAGTPERLPVDQHELIALCAPRPVLISNGIEDRWANPEGQFVMLREADPVYRLFGLEGMKVTYMPHPTTLVASRLGCFVRAGGHGMIPADWEAWLTYADRWMRTG